MEIVLASLVTAVPATLASLAAWRSAKASRAETATVAETLGSQNGLGPAMPLLESMSERIDRLIEWKGRHEALHTNSQN